MTVPQMIMYVHRLQPMPNLSATLTLVLVILQCFHLDIRLTSVVKHHCLCEWACAVDWLVRVLLLCCCAWLCCEVSARTQSHEEKTALSLTPSTTARMEFDVTNFWRTHLTVAVDGLSCWPSVYKFHYFHYVNLRAFNGGFFW